jgi:hypothetical protein
MKQLSQTFIRCANDVKRSTYTAVISNGKIIFSQFGTADVNVHGENKNSNILKLYNIFDEYSLCLCYILCVAGQK